MIKKDVYLETGYYLFITIFQPEKFITMKFE